MNQYPLNDLLLLVLVALKNRGNQYRIGRVVSSPFSSSLLAFFLKVFHHDARSRFEGGDAAFWDVEGICCCGAATADD